MLRSVKSLFGYVILAKDGDIGRAHDFFFDDEEWTIRYLVVDTHYWLPGRKVLISPVALEQPDSGSYQFPVNLTKDQVKDSPDIDADKPFSRQQQIDLHTYYGWPYYWPVGGYFVPPSLSPPAKRVKKQPQKETGDPHLRSTKEVTGYHIGATDGGIGHVEDFILEEEDWMIRYMVVDTKNWLPGRKVLISPQWVERVSWSERKVHVGLPRESIRNSPEYDAEAPVNREYEVRLYDYYGRPTYWP